MTDFKIHSQESALLIVDMQNGFLHPESGMGRSPSGTARQLELVPRILTLIEFFRRKKIPLLWTQQEHFPDDFTRARKTLRTHAAKQGFLPCLRGTWETEIFPAFQAVMRPEDHIVAKHRASAFYNTNLETKLRMLGTKFLFIAGCNTEFCIESTVRDAYARDFELIVVRDCVAGINPVFHENSLAVFENYFAEVLKVAQIQEIVA